MNPVAITAWQVLGAAGAGRQALLAAIRANKPCLRPIRLLPLPFPTLVGEYPGPLPPLPPGLARYDCRNARLARAALEQDGFRRRVEAALDRYGAARVGLVLGTSTSGIYDSEAAYRHFVAHGEMSADFDFIHRHAVHATAEALASDLGLAGPVVAVSTACSSSAKALGTARRLLLTGICDAVLAAGVDTLCSLTLFGFHSLGLVAEAACRPLDADRRGISIGEAAALLLLEKASAANRACPRLLAVGESSDAHHLAAPDPQGRGAEAAMAAALAGLDPARIDYVKLHATATPLNDLAEAQAVERLFGDRVPCGGLKGLLGHTLGASGALETVALLEALEHGWLPGTCGLETPDPACRLNLQRQPRRQQAGRVLGNAFGFGGSNASVLLGREADAVTEPVVAVGIGVKVTVVCTPEEAWAASLDVETALPDPKRIPAAIRRRTGEATRLALCAGFLACERAGVDPRELPAVFASVGGEMQITDRLLVELAKPEGCVSPTAFHNSVHNAASGYWSIATGSRQPATALGAGEATFAMAWLEAWIRLLTEAERVLLVCYEERWPPHLQPGMGRHPAALAWVLERGGRIGPPEQTGTDLPADLQPLAASSPVLAGLALVRALGNENRRTVALGGGWSVELR
ncbi:3-oxoacyl-[acyl-carrier-protein] synthase I [Methylomarinovum caldicuralii]|uniref:3-oxoacyl-[acyl-carrier-protein] synthase I n=1 Tax=Methylomarinovum caldicuralii TaxID=438856 RepID=A0AAU9BZY8_9GAMM|nr:beta-ketoacyl-ACP synthase [Methylomarinovum caldicuralii]BCX80848.1 3-oxoacyl-[acyl-carrier-protein] synthase I [Methylomarinovum caldicuralii]